MSLSRLLRLVVSLATLNVTAACQDTSGEVAVDSAAKIEDTAQARTFVQSFYAWYAPQAASGASWAEVLRRDTLIHPLLLALLREDYAIRGNDEPPRSTIDGDPFTGQDPCSAFAVQGAEPVGNRFLVTVLEQCAEPRLTPAMSYVLEVGHDGKHWEIMNVRYGGDSVSLVEYLCKYALADRRAEKRPATCAPP